MLIFAVAVILALSLVAGAIQVKVDLLRLPMLIGAAVVLLLGVVGSSFRYVGENEVGIVVKNTFGPSLPPGKIIATEGEKGPQAEMLPPGWHLWLWPIIFDVDLVQIQEIHEGEVGLLTASDGQPLPEGSIYAPEWVTADRKKMAEDAKYFLTDGGGYKGPQTSVLTPGKYRLNTKLFTIDVVSVTNVEKATVGVVKSNVGDEPPAAAADSALVDQGQRGIWRTPLLPKQYNLNTKAFEVTDISTAKNVVRYTKTSAGIDRLGEEQEITVRSSDGFTFPVDVRVEYEIKPADAPLVVANFSDDKDRMRERLNSAVRAIFRNNAESVKALDYVQQRSTQESQSLAMLVIEMEKVGVTVTAVRIGDVGDEQTLGELLKTQTDREIAVQEQITFQEQEKAAEQEKSLTRTQQEAEEERRLATASYEVKIAEQDKERRIIEANAEAEAIQIKAQAQADAYEKIALQIGKGNAALIEILKIVGEAGIQITPRVMVVGGENGSSGDAQTTALIGTMLDSMVSKGEGDQ